MMTSTIAQTGANSTAKRVVLLISKTIKINAKKARMAYAMYLPPGILNLLSLCNSGFLFTKPRYAIIIHVQIIMLSTVENVVI